MNPPPRASALLLPLLVLLALGLAVLALDLNLALELWLRSRLAFAGTTAWSAATLAGDALVTPLAIAPFLARRPRLGAEGMLAALLATVGVHVLKPLVHMPRPAAVIEGMVVIGPRLLAGSFPSGHTASAFTVLGLLVAAGQLRGWLPLVTGALLASLVGLSRVMVGAHWPADVLAGAALGWCCGWAAVWLLRKLPGAGRPALAGSCAGLLAVLAVFDLIGHDTGYPQGIWLQWAVALACLLVLGWQWLRRAIRVTH